MDEERETWFYPVAISLSVMLACFSATSSGLTLGLMSLDMTQLHVLMLGDPGKKTSLCLLPPNHYLAKCKRKIKKKKKQKRQSISESLEPQQQTQQHQKKEIDAHTKKLAYYARRVFPLRVDANYLLVTLLVGNVSVNSAFALISGEITGGLIAFFISTAVITIFGEILPQAVCARYGLRIGSFFAPVVVFLEWLLFIICKPMASALDLLLGEDLGTSYSMTQLTALVRHHEREKVFGTLEARILLGALTVGSTPAASIMKRLNDAFYVTIDDVLSTNLLKTIASKGYSRVPVINNSPDISYPKVESVLLLKDLMLVEANDEVRVEDMVRCLGCKVYAVDKETPLLSVLDTLLHLHDKAPTDAAIAGVHVKSHLVVLQEAIECEDQDNVMRDVGFVTLEDVLETLLGRHVLDETEIRRAVSSSPSPGGLEAELSSPIGEFDYTRLFDPQRGPVPLSEREAHLIASFLLRRIPTDVIRMPPEQWRIPLGEWLTGHPVQNGRQLQSTVLCQEGQPTRSTFLLLQGSGHVPNPFAKIGAWSVLCVEALVKSDYLATSTVCLCDEPDRQHAAEYPAGSNPSEADLLSNGQAHLGSVLYLEISSEEFQKWFTSVSNRFSSPRHTTASVDPRIIGDAKEPSHQPLEISQDAVQEAAPSLKDHYFGNEASIGSAADLYSNYPIETSIVLPC